MEAQQQTSNENYSEKTSATKSSFYASVWRWHFYAGVIFAPFLIILAFSGGVYLFKPQIESVLYHDLYYVENVGDQSLSSSELVNNVLGEYPDGKVTAMTFFDDPERTSEISVETDSEVKSVFIDPYSGKINGSMNSEETITETFKKLHSELIVGGTAANRIVELAACWAVILLATGLYVWWPRNKSSIWGTILPRIRARGRTFWRDIHAVPAFWLSLLILILILTGLPWSGVMGEQINRIATATHTGYPAFAFSSEDLESDVKTKDVGVDVPWAAENVPVPDSQRDGNGTLAIDYPQTIADSRNIEKPYTISMPQGETGVYTISAFHDQPWKDGVMHVDQYNGDVLSDVRYDDYGVMAKAISLGISLHEGKLFGLANQIIGLIVCIGLIGIILSSFVMWRKRKPSGTLGAPKKPMDKKITRTVFVIMLVLGVLMPLIGISIIIIFLIDKLLVQRIPKLKNWTGA